PHDPRPFLRAPRAPPAARPPADDRHLHRPGRGRDPGRHPARRTRPVARPGRLAWHYVISCYWGMTESVKEINDGWTGAAGAGLVGQAGRVAARRAARRRGPQ